jgi:hypothetical protein
MTTQVPEEFEVTLRNGLLIIQFNRPSKKNAFNAQVLQYVSIIDFLLLDAVSDEKCLYYMY